MGGRKVIPRRLKEARQRAGLSQKRLGIEAGIDQFAAGPRINQYESGKHSPDFRTMERLADVLGVPTPYFYARDEALAAWILAFTRLTPAERRSVIRKSDG